MLHTLARRTLSFLALGVVCLVPVLAHAQVAPLSTWTGGPFPNVLWQHPNLADDGMRINCAPGTAGCTPLNRSMCGQPGRPISFIIAPPSTSGGASYTGQTETLYAYLSISNTCSYSDVPGGANYNPNYLIGKGQVIGSSVFLGGSTPFVFPTGGITPGTVFPNVLETGFLTSDFLSVINACPDDPNKGVQLATYYICVGVDVTQTTGINNGTAGSTSSTSTGSSSTNSTDPFAYVQFQVDTLPPSTPTNVAVQPLDGRCDIKVNYNTTTLDAYYLRVKATADPNNLALQAEDPDTSCDAWGDNVIVHDVNIYGDTSGVETLTVNGDNGVLYGFCVETIDYMQNVSAPSPVIFGRPRPECDLFKCYPDALQTGFCGATLPPGAYGIVGLLALWRAARRRCRAPSIKGAPSC